MKPAIIDIVGIGPAAADTLAENGFRTLRSLARTTVEKLSAVPGFSEARAERVIAAAAELLPAPAAPAPTGDTEKPAKEAKKDKKDKKGKKDKKDKKKKKGKKDKKKKGK
jgi:hypothetical protein